MKTSENNVKYSNFNMGGMDKSRELYSKEGDSSSDLKEKQCRGNTLLNLYIKFRRYYDFQP